MQRPGKTLIVDYELPQRDPFRAERAPIDRIVGIALDMDDRRFHVAGFVAECVNDHAASHGTVRADAVRFRGSGDLEFSGLRECWRDVKSKSGRYRSTSQDTLDETPTAEFHCRNF